MSNFAKFEFRRINLKIERVFEKTNKMLSQKLAKRDMNLVSKKDHIQCQISLMRKKYFFCKIKSLYTINNLCVVIEIISSYFSYGLKMMSRNTLSEPQPDSASLTTFFLQFMWTSHYLDIYFSFFLSCVFVTIFIYIQYCHKFFVTFTMALYFCKASRHII